LNSKNKIPQKFYLSDDVINTSKLLLGKILVTNINNKITSGMITEVEAYLGINDKASHTYNNKRTSRTEPMFSKGGIVYIYLCYGIHHLINIVVGKRDFPSAILIRSIKPVDGIKTMMERRNFKKLTKELTNGPGKLTKALGITMKYNSISLNSKKIWIENHNIIINKKDILSSSRIGVDYAGEDAKLPYRFYIKNNKWISK